jgi:hypothetical protein
MRGVAQLASVLAWGASGRPFESGHPDKMRKAVYLPFFMVWPRRWRGTCMRCNWSPVRVGTPRLLREGIQK